MHSICYFMTLLSNGIEEPVETHKTGLFQLTPRKTEQVAKNVPLVILLQIAVCSRHYG